MAARLAMGEGEILPPRGELEAKLERIQAEHDALPDHFDGLAAVVLDGKAATKARSHAPRKLIERLVAHR